LDSIQDRGDPAYDLTRNAADAWDQAFETWSRSLEVTPGTVTTASLYRDFLDRLGFTGFYRGDLYTSSRTPTAATLTLRDHGGEVHGTLTVVQPTLPLDGGFCGAVTMPVSTFAVRLTSTGPTHPWPPTATSRFDGRGSTSRDVTVLGLFSGQVVVELAATLYNQRASSELFGTIHIRPPGPCQDQHVNVHFTRNNDALIESFGYRPPFNE
jgi:hypothetical protein